jgi:hypothetical protein
MVFEVRELDNASERTRRPGCVGYALDVVAVVAAFGTREKQQRAELGGAHTLGSQLADGQIGPLKRLVKPGRDARVLWDGARDALDVIE